MKPHFYLSIVALGLVLLGCKPQTQDSSAVVIRPVRAMVVGSPTQGSTGGYSAEIRPRIESQLSFRVGGKVVERLVELGAVVRKDQALMRLDPADLELTAKAALAQVAAAQANDDVAQAALKRAQELAKQNFYSQGALDQAQGAANAARANLAAAQANSNLGLNAVQYGVLRADADGVVTGLSAEVGQILGAGTPAVRLAVGREKDLVLAVPETALATLKKGTVLDVQLWSKPGFSLSATVRDVSAMADPVTRSFTLKAALKDPQNEAALGATASVYPKLGAALGAGAKPALVIPLSSLVEAKGGQGETAVWVIENETVKKRVIRLAPGMAAANGARNEAPVAVLEGLKNGDVIAVAGVHTLVEGQKVRALLDQANSPAAALNAPSKP
jgi:RND family efflux transporter MFP subunit